MKRILVIGVSGAGKSTLARELSARLKLPFTPTDDLYWRPGWQGVPVAELRVPLETMTGSPHWVLDGNFDDLRELVWERADTIVWLDYPRYVVVPRLVKRNLGWYISLRPVWSGNTMTLARVLSGIRHSLRGFARKRENYPVWLQNCPHAHVVRFWHPGEGACWLETL